MVLVPASQCARAILTTPVTINPQLEAQVWDTGRVPNIWRDAVCLLHYSAEYDYECEQYHA